MQIELSPTIARWHRSPWALAIAVGLVVSCWILGNPRSAGPDEPSHMVASAAIVRGEWTGVEFGTDPTMRAFEVPNMVGEPNPSCWAFQSDVSVACAAQVELNTETVFHLSTSSNYAPWVFVIPGLASFVPWAYGYAYLARALNALIPTVLIIAAFSMLARHHRVLGAAAFAGMTPIVWFTLGTVSPSAVAIGGGLALWASLLTPSTRYASALGIAGWTTMLLARRDGPLWATAIVLTCCGLLGVRPRQLWNQLGRSARWIPIVLLPIPLLPSLRRGDLGFNLLLGLMPLALGVADVGIGLWARLRTTAARWALAATAPITAILATLLVLQRRSNGFDLDTLSPIPSSTGKHLQELVGVLGWLDAPVPMSAVLLFWATIGGLAAVAYLEQRRAAVVFAGAFCFAVVAAWMLELGQGNNYGVYWQGRYTMPFAVGLPLLLAWRSGANALIDRLAVPIVSATWLIINLGFVESQRRWAVGIYGTWSPFRWDTWSAPIAPVVLVLVHAAITAAVAALVISQPERPARTLGSS